jgi:hypothetical protein
MQLNGGHQRMLPSISEISQSTPESSIDFSWERSKGYESFEHRTRFPKLLPQTAQRIRIVSMPR